MGVNVRNAGVWKGGIPYVRHSGAWKIPRSYVKRSGVWVPAYALQPLSRTLADLNLASGLRLCLDAGDTASYASGQSWLDTSGNGYDFFRGANGSAGGDDPTFVGTPGGLSSGQYWSFDGGDYFRYDTTNETWMQNIHKNNAKFTIAGYTYIGSLGVTATLVGTQSVAGGTGITYTKPSADTLRIDIANAGGNVLQEDSANSFVANSWNFHAVTIDEAAGTGSLFLNGAVTSFTSTYASPSTGTATATMEIAARGGGNTIVPASTRFAMLAAWESVALTQDQLTALFQATRDRYGI